MQGCRRFIEVDGCHLKTRFSRVLLSVVSMDANNRIYPLAVAMCEAENKDNWCWFFTLLKEHMGFLDGMSLTIMSDQQKGLIVVCAQHFEGATI